MSRDWAPWEVYAAEQENIAEGRGDYWDFLKNTVMSFNGSLTRLCPDDELALRKQFPVLGKLLTNTGEYNFINLYEKLSAIYGGLEMLSRKDKELSDFIATGEGDKESYLLKWFLGDLDRNFHYSNYNDHLFGEGLIKDALIQSSKDKLAVVPLSELFINEVKMLDEASGNSVSDMVDSEGYAWGLFADQKLIGYCTIGGADVLEGEEVEEYPGYSCASLLLSDVFVLPEHRGKGAAVFMVNEAIKKANGEAKEPVFLTLLEDGLCFLYEKCGFELIGDGLMVRDDKIRSVDTILSNATQTCEDMNKDIEAKCDVEFVKE